MDASGSDHKLLHVSCYTNFADLAHTPRGTEAADSVISLSLDTTSGKLTKISAISGIHNPAFMRYHPQKRLIYAATESIDAPGDIEVLGVDPDVGELHRLGSQSAHGASTCYITLSPDAKALLFTNYWDGSLGAMPVSADGRLGPVCSLLEPPVPVRANSRKDHLQNRQSESHAHAIILDPVFGRVAFVPDLGMDLIRQYMFDTPSGSLTPVGSIPCAPPEAGPHGPRYIEFDPLKKTAYVVNELSSSVSVFRFDKEAAAQLIDTAAPRPTLHLLQVVSTLPTPSPSAPNTCGRIAVHPSGGFVLVSNRGHDSIAVFGIRRAPDGHPSLALLDVAGTRGQTPRHFAFVGGFVVAANQDSDSLTVFHFDQGSGRLTFTGNTFECPSPNFICVQPESVAQPVPPSTSVEF